MCYFSAALQPKELKKGAIVAQKLLKHFHIAPEYVVGRGVSGILALPVYAELLDCEIAVSRKPGDSSHAGSDKIEAADEYKFAEAKSIVVIDDFVDSGSTLIEIRKHLQTDHLERYVEHAVEIVPKVIILYNACGGSSLMGGRLNNSEWSKVPTIGLNHHCKEVYTKNLEFPKKLDIIGGYEVHPIKVEDYL